LLPQHQIQVLPGMFHLLPVNYAVRHKIAVLSSQISGQEANALEI